MLANGAYVGGVGCDGMSDISLLRIDDGVQILNVEASSFREPTVGHVVSRLLALAREEGGRLVVSLAMVEDMTSAGVGALVKVTDEVSRLGGKVVFVGLREDLAIVLDSTGLSRRLHLADTIVEGMKLVRKSKGLFARFGKAA